MPAAGAIYCDRHGEKLTDGGCPKCGPERTRADARARRPRAAAGVVAIDPRCSVTSGPYRCPAPAIWYPGRAAAGRCRLHADDQRIPREGPDLQDQLRAMLDDPAAAVRAMYRADADEESAWRHALVATGSRAVAFQRADGEARDAYHDRMRETARKLAVGIGKGARREDRGRTAAPPSLRPSIDTDALVDEVEEIAARHELDGMPRIAATRMALQAAIARALGDMVGGD